MPREGKPNFFRSLQAAAAAADEREKGSTRRRRRTPRPARRVSAASRPHPSRLTAVLAAAALGVAPGVAVVLWVGEEDSSPPTGQRAVCARDLVLRDSPGPARGGERELYRGEILHVDRYASGPEGPHTYAHGTAEGREAPGHGWVTEKYLCP